MRVVQAKIQRKTTGGCDVIDITGDVVRAIAGTGVVTGIAVVAVAGSTAAITTIEYEEGVVQDFKDALERLVPRSAVYRHDQAWGDGNGYSHVRAALLGPSCSFPVQQGRPLLGTWQQIVLVDVDNRPRSREVVLQVVGE